MSRFRTLALTVIAVAVALTGGTPAAAQGNAYEVTITNLTPGQIMSPPIVVSHRRNFRVFETGEAASPELAAVAEDADSAGLIALLGTEPRVGSVEIGSDVILPGQSQTVTISLAGGFKNVTVLGMLVTTNDAFYAAGGQVVRSGDTFIGPAYDAGSEANTQRCAHIPGPPCGNPGVRVTNGAEGFIHVSPGVRRAGNLSERTHDWRNPTVRVTVARAR